jgi:predicted amidophosphoribosyltransferase
MMVVTPKCPFCKAVVPKGNSVCERCGMKVAVELSYFCQVVLLPLLAIFFSLLLFFWWRSTW